MKKRVLAIILAMSMLLVFAACGNKDKKFGDSTIKTLDSAITTTQFVGSIGTNGAPGTNQEEGLIFGYVGIISDSQRSSYIDAAAKALKEVNPATYQNITLTDSNVKTNDLVKQLLADETYGDMIESIIDFIPDLRFLLFIRLRPMQVIFLKMLSLCLL